MASSDIDPALDAADETKDADTFPRRVFIQRLTFFGGGVVLLGAACRNKPPPEPASAPVLAASSHKSFTDEEYRIMSAAVDRILPKDQDAGALEAGVPEYIDRMLQSPELFQMREDFVTGLGHFEKRARSIFKKGFVELAPDEKDQVLVSYKDSKPGTGEAHFYELLVTLTLEGFLGDPSYGGNKDHVGWALVGFETSEPPPGHDGEKMLHHLHGGH